MTIKLSQNTLDKTQNPLIKMTMEMIMHNSEKHKVMQQMIIDSLTKEAVHLNPDELSLISGELEKHIDAEAKSMELADAALKNSDLFATRFILSHLQADETKHHILLSQLDELKRAVVFIT